LTSREALSFRSSSARRCVVATSPALGSWSRRSAGSAMAGTSAASRSPGPRTPTRSRAALGQSITIGPEAVRTTLPGCRSRCTRPPPSPSGAGSSAGAGMACRWRCSPASVMACRTSRHGRRARSASMVGPWRRSKIRGHRPQRHGRGRSAHQLQQRSMVLPWAQGQAAALHGSWRIDHDGNTRTLTAWALTTPPLFHLGPRAATRCSPITERKITSNPGH
jgi:hypothetical protein